MAWAGSWLGLQMGRYGSPLQTTDVTKAALYLQAWVVSLAWMASLALRDQRLLRVISCSAWVLERALPL